MLNKNKKVGAFRKERSEIDIVGYDILGYDILGYAVNLLLFDRQQMLEGGKFHSRNEDVAGGGELCV